jgi:hypothetical protein
MSRLCIERRALDQAHEEGCQLHLQLQTDVAGVEIRIHATKVKVLAQLAQGESKKAVEILTQALSQFFESNPSECIVLLHLLIKAYFFESDWSAIVAVATKIIGVDKTNMRAFLKRGEARLKLVNRRH